MKKGKDNMTLLDEAILELEIKKSSGKVALHQHWQDTVESLRPSHLINQAVNDIATTPKTKGNILLFAASLVGGYASKKLLIGNSKSNVRKLFGFLVQAQFTKFIASKIKSANNSVSSESIKKEDMNTSNINKDTIDGLQDLLKKNYDAENGYKQVLQKTKNDSLKKWLRNQAAQRSHFATEIDQELRSLNETPADSGTALAAAHRTWIDVKTAVASDTDEAILEECIRGEKASVSEYESQINSNKFPGKLNSLLVDQCQKIKSTLDLAKSLEKIA